MEHSIGNGGRRTKSDSRNSLEMFASCSFSSLGLHPTLCEQLKERLAFEAPTQVQAQVIPVVLSGRHVLVNAATGSGKTVAYLAPIIHLLQNNDQRIQRSDGTFALVLVPTRELCMQVYDILQKLLHRFHWIVPGYIMGGENRAKEKARLRKGVCILVATPGRLLDHLKNTSSFQHSKLRWIIFDEADRILELGYGKEIEDILNCLGTRQCKNSAPVSSALAPEVPMQNLLLSATLNEKVNHLAKISLENPVMIGLDDKKISVNQNHDRIYIESDVLDGVEESGTSQSNLTEDYNIPAQLIQKFVKVPCGSRLVVLLSILKHLIEREACQKCRTYGAEKSIRCLNLFLAVGSVPRAEIRFRHCMVVVFFSTCDAVDFHYSLLNEFLWPSTLHPESEKQIFLRCNTLRLHGKMNQDDRKKSFQAFKTEKSALLLSTDISARGLDFPKVKFIIQYDSPGEATEYVHRVGRTARLGEKGESVLFLQPSEVDYLNDLEKHNVMLAEYPLLKIMNSFPSYNRTDRSGKFASIEMHPWLLTLQRVLESFISSQARMQKLAKAAFCSWVRAYTAHRGELKQLFMVKKLHLGHVARSFALKEQPSLVNKSIQKQIKKRKRSEIHHKVKSKKRDVGKL